MKPIKEKKVKVKPAVKLIRYSVKAVIPTGAYANIQPEIVVEANTLEEAEKFVMPYMEKIFAKYREPQVVSSVSQSPIGAYIKLPKSVTTTASAVSKPPVNVATTSPAAELVTPLAGETCEMPPKEKKPTTPNTTVSFTRAFRAVMSCMTVEALDLIKNQIIKSVKLTDSEKAELAIVVEAKLTELKQSNESNIPRQ